MKLMVWLLSVLAIVLFVCVVIASIVMVDAIAVAR